jgi:hypothetical protein
MLFYLLVAFIYLILLNNQLKYMIIERSLPPKYIRFYTNDEVSNFNRMIDGFVNSVPTHDEHIAKIALALALAAFMVSLLSSLVWPVMLVIDVLSLLKKQ